MDREEAFRLVARGAQGDQMPRSLVEQLTIDVALASAVAGDTHHARWMAADCTARALAAEVDARPRIHLVASMKPFVWIRPRRNP